MKIQSEHDCPVHAVKHEVEIPETSKRSYEAWKAGLGYVQDIPGVSASEREILLTGTCGEAWDSMFAEEFCSDDCDGSSHPGLMCK